MRKEIGSLSETQFCYGVSGNGQYTENLLRNDTPVESFRDKFN